MKGITSCAECAYYKWNKCKKKAHIHGVDFFADCPLPEVLTVNPEANNWSTEDMKGKTIFGYPAVDVIKLANLMAFQNVRAEDVKNFLRAVEQGYNYGLNQAKKKWNEAIEKAVNEETRREE